MADHDITDLRQDYDRGALLEGDLPDEPISAFGDWMHTALESGVAEPHAATLATADAEGRPSARIVLCRGFDDRGFAFYTNYDGRKARDIDANPRAALCFFWQPLERQVRIEGTVERVADADSDAYFARRPRASQLGAWTSPQSRILGDRAELERLYEDTRARFEGVDQVPRPDDWGGYRILPERVEFWQGRPSRLHDRIVFERAADGWSKARLAP